MELLGYIASLFIGIALGLIGGGGSILTVPVLTLLFGVDAVLATAYSLFIVGTTSLFGVYPKFREGLVNFKTALIFGAPSIVAVYLTRSFIIPAIPNQLFTLGNLNVTKGVLLMVLFAVLMVAASVSMIRKPKKQVEVEGKQVFNYPLIFLEGALVGVLTGLVGAGGGFLIIPALVILSKLPMKEAIGTSLLIIAAKSLIGFTGDIGKQTFDWTLLLSITLLAVIGIFIGNLLARKIDGDKLKTSFGWFVLVMGAYLLISQLFFPQPH